MSRRQSGKRGAISAPASVVVEEAAPRSSKRNKPALPGWSSLSLAELKKLCIANNVDTKKCSLKAHFVKRLTEAKVVFDGTPLVAAPPVDSLVAIIEPREADPAPIVDDPVLPGPPLMVPAPSVVQPVVVPVLAASPDLEGRVQMMLDRFEQKYETSMAFMESRWLSAFAPAAPHVAVSPPSMTSAIPLPLHVSAAPQPSVASPAGPQPLLSWFTPAPRPSLFDAVMQDGQLGYPKHGPGGGGPHGI